MLQMARLRETGFSCPLDTIMQMQKRFENPRRHAKQATKFPNHKVSNGHNQSPFRYMVP